MDICIKKDCDRYNTKFDTNCEIHNGPKLCKFFKPLKAKEAPSSSLSGVGLEGPLFDKHNAGLVWLISHLAFLVGTQKPLKDEDYQKADEILEILRQDLYSIKAD